MGLTGFSQRRGPVRTLEYPKDKHSQRLMMINVVNSYFDASWDAHNGAMQKVARRYDLFRGINTAKYHTRRNKVHIPMALSLVMGDVAQKMQIGWGTYPNVEFQASDPNLAQYADNQTALFREQLDDFNARLPAYIATCLADIYGNGIVQWGWETTVNPKKFRRRASDIYGNSREYFEEANHVTFDGPMFWPVDVLDAFPDVGIPLIGDMRRFGRRYYLDFDDVYALGKAKLPDGSTVYDPDEVKALQDSTTVDSRRGFRYSDRQSLNNNLGDPFTKQDDVARPVEIFDLHGWMPRELAPDGYQIRLLTVGNGNTLLRNVPHPMGEVPFLNHSPIQDPHYFHSMGKIEPIERLQVAVNKMANQQLDAADQNVDPQWLVARGAVNKRNLFSMAGRIIEVEGAVGDDKIRPLSPDMRGMKELYPLQGLFWHYMQQATGVFEGVGMGGGSGGSDRETALEVQTRSASAGLRIGLESMLMEKQIIEPLAQAFVRMNRLWLNEGKQVEVLGENAHFDFLTGREMPSSVAISLEDLHHDFKARARGSSRIIDRETKALGLERMIGSALANPSAAITVNWRALLMRTFQLHDPENASRFINRPGSPEEAQNAQVMQMGGGGGAPPSDPNNQQGLAIA